MEGRPTVVMCASPARGATDDERVFPAGAVTDNVAVGDVRWESDGVNLGALSLTEGRFQIAGLLLHPGEHRFRAVARDHTGNAPADAVVTIWEPSRSLTTLETPRTAGSSAPARLG